MTPSTSSQTKLATLWRKTSGLPFGHWLFSKFLQNYVPYSGTIGAYVQDLSPGFAILSMHDKRKVRNHLHCIHAIALMNLGELTSGLALNIGLPANVRAIVTNMNIEFLKKARGTLKSKCRCEIPNVTQDMSLTVNSEIFNQQDEKVAIITVQWQLGLIQPNQP